MLQHQEVQKGLVVQYRYLILVLFQEQVFGNTRKELSIDTLGVPVIAIGIPTVVESAVMVNEALDLFIKKLQDEARSNDYLNELQEKDNYEEIKEALNPGDYNMIVTPKEIDELINNMKEIVSRRNKLCFIEQDKEHK